MGSESIDFQSTLTPLKLAAKYRSPNNLIAVAEVEINPSAGLYFACCPPPFRPTSVQPHDRSEQSGTHRFASHRRGNQGIVHQLFDERHRVTRTARCARRAQARSPARAVRDERTRSRSRPPLQEVRDSSG